MTTKTRVHNCKRSRCTEPFLIILHRGDRYYGDIGLYRSECNGHDYTLSDWDVLKHWSGCAKCHNDYATLASALDANFPRPPADPNDLPFE